MSSDVSPISSGMIRTGLDIHERYGVLVIGGGNAALCAATSARRAVGAGDDGASRS